MLKSLFQKVSPALIVKEAKAPMRTVSEHEQQLAAVCALSVAEARARMVRLEAKQAAVAAGGTWPAQIIPCALLVRPGQPTTVLALDRDVVIQLESAAELPTLLAKQGQADTAGYRVLLRHAVAYQPDRTLYDCLALKLFNGAPPLTAGPSATSASLANAGPSSGSP